MTLVIAAETAPLETNVDGKLASISIQSLYTHSSRWSSRWSLLPEGFVEMPSSYEDGPIRKVLPELNS